MWKSYYKFFQEDAVKKAQADAKPKMKAVQGVDGKVYVPFYKSRHVFSNFYHCEKLSIDDIEFRNTEQYFAYRKAVFSKDTAAAEKIKRTSDPAQAKALGRGIKNFDAKGWNHISYDVMKTACLHKFRQNPDLREELFKTIGAYLVEAAPRDQIWGIGLGIDNPLIGDPSKWRGQNKLGNALNEARDELAKEFPEEADVFRDFYTRALADSRSST
ncbi:hypothetical protein AAVH_37722 [Aphelenchoides avenae]|nr:hypothetical protein AAVH_37722 [Aphelenchus avenae]